MVPGGGALRAKHRKRWALALVLLAIVLGAGALAIRRESKPPAGRDPMRLELLHAAWNEFNAQNYDAATATLDRRVAEVEPTPLDWMLRARIARAQGRTAEALEHLKHIPDSDPISAKSWLLTGQLELGRNHSKAAEAAYLRSLALDPNQIQPHRELAYLYALQRRKADCDAQFRSLAQLTNLDDILVFAWCQNYCGIWDPKEASKLLRGFLAEDPDDRWSRLALATSCRLTNQHEEVEKVLGTLPDTDGDARAIRIEHAIDQGQIARAQELAREGPIDNSRLSLMRGELALMGNNPRQAAEYFRAVLRAESEDRDATHGLGLALHRMGDPQAGTYREIAARQDELKRTIIASVTTIHTDPKLFFKLGEMCASLNRLEEARTWFQLAIGRDPLDAQAHQALARLNK
jgi:predicted Zn-dependent protease